MGWKGGRSKEGEQRGGRKQGIKGRSRGGGM